LYYEITSFAGMTKSELIQLLTIYKENFLLNWKNMRHNSSLSYRSDRKITLAFSGRFFSLVILSAALFFYAAPLFSQQNVNRNEQNNTVTNTQNNTQAEERVPGQGFDDQDFGPQVEEESVIWMIFKTLIVLGLFVGGFYMFYKFVTQKAGLQVSGHEAIKILSMVPVGPNRTLQLIDVAGKVYLLGISESGITMLTEIKDKEEIDRIRLLSSRSTPVKDLTFQDFISDQVGWVVDRFNDVKGRISDRKSHGRKAAVQEIPSKDFDMSYLDIQKKRLKTINDEDEE